MATKKTTKKKLSKKEQLFVAEYVKTGNATQSAITAGYSPNSARTIAYRMLNKEYIKEAVQELMDSLKKETIAEADEVLQLLTSIARGETYEENVVTDKTGTHIVKTKVGEKDRVKALELLGKRYKLYTDKVEASGNIGVSISFKDDLEDDTDENN